MKQNVGSFDRIVRLAIGAALLVVGVLGYAGFVSLAWIGIGQALASILGFVVGTILVGTALNRTCLIYTALGVSTARSAGEPESMTEKPA